MIRYALPIFIFLCILDGVNVAANPIDDLTLLQRKYLSSWNEGYIKAKTAGSFGPAELEVWWAGDRVRREFRFYGIDGSRNPKRIGHVLSSSQYCRFTPSMLQATCSTRKEFGTLAIPLRVMPSESWLELMYLKPLDKWLKDSPGATQVFKTANAEFVALFANQSSDVDLCTAFIRKNGLTDIDELQLAGSAVIAHFSEHGLPNRIWFIGVPERNQFELSYEWTTEKRPVLKRFTRKLSTDSGKTFDLDFELVVLESSRTLDKHTPSLSIPPTDLPFGTAINDKRGPRDKLTYVGGEAGKVHYSLQRTVRALETVK